MNSNNSHNGMTAPATHPPLTRYHSQIESDVNSLLGVKDSHLLSIAITGLGGGAFLPAAGEKSLAEAQGGAQLQTQPAPSSVVDSTARCLFFCWAFVAVSAAGSHMPASPAINAARFSSILENR